MSEYIKCFLLLERRDRRKVILVSIAQILLGLLDFLGVALFGAIGALAVSAVQSGKPISAVEKILEILNIVSLQIQLQVAILGLLASSVLTFRTFLSIFVNKKLLLFLGKRGSDLSSRYIDRFLRLRIATIQKRNSQEIMYAITDGIAELTIGVIGIGISTLADIFLLLILLIGLIFVGPYMALVLVLIFISFGLISSRTLHHRARDLGNMGTQLRIKSNQVMMELIFGYREIFTRGQINSYSKKISEIRREIGKNQGTVSFLPYIGKYVIEAITIIGIVMISGIQFATSSAMTAVSTLSFFLASLSRIAPAALRIQQSFLTMRTVFGSARVTLEVIEELEETPTFPDVGQQVHPEAQNTNFQSNLKIENLNFRFSSNSDWLLRDIDFQVDKGQSLGIMGPSGAGKSTLVDLILGLREPSSGKVTIAGMTPTAAINTWPGKIAYVPQEPYFSDLSIREIVGMGFKPEEIEEARVISCLKLAHLWNFVETLDQGLEFQIGERGSRLSGGQRQRLAIARALYTDPDLLILDEATSALDVETEEQIRQSIEDLIGHKTLIVISHRLSLLKSMSAIIVMRGGEIELKGSYDEALQKLKKLQE